jgi:WD40 repeat protein
VVNREQQPKLVSPVGHTQPVILTHFSDDGKTMLTVGSDDKVLRWDVATGKLLGTVINESGPFGRFWDKASTFSPSGKYLVVSEGGWLALYDIEKKQKVADLRTKDEKYTTRFNRVDFTADMKKLIARGEGQERRPDFNIVIVGYAAAWNIEDGSLISEFSDSKRDNGEAAFAANYANEKLIAPPAPPQDVPEVEVGPAIRDPWASSRNAGPLYVGNKLTLRDRESNEVLLEKVLNLNDGRGISFSPDGKKMALPMNDNTVTIVELR